MLEIRRWTRAFRIPDLARSVYPNLVSGFLLWGEGLAPNPQLNQMLCNSPWTAMPLHPRYAH